MGFCLQLPLSVPEQADQGRVLGLAGRGAARCPSPDTLWCSVTELTRNAAKSRSLDVREACPASVTVPGVPLCGWNFCPKPVWEAGGDGGWCWLLPELMAGEEVAEQGLCRKGTGMKPLSRVRSDSAPPSLCP